MKRKGIFKQSFFHFRRTTFFLSVILFLLLVILFNIIGWYLYFVVRNSKEDELGKRLITVANMVASYLGKEAVILSFAKGDEETNWYKSLKEYLIEVKGKNNLRTLSIFNTDYRWMIGTEDDMKIGTYSPLLIIDEEEIKKCIKEKVSTESYLYSFEDIQYKRAYAPIIGFNEEIEAFVRVEASRDYFIGLAKLRNNLIFLGLICIVVIGILVVIFYQLVSALIRAEENIELTNRLHALGTMAAGVAHEIRNPLSIIKNTAEILKSELTDKPEISFYTDSILEEAHRLNNLVSQFLQLSKPSVMEKSNCNVVELIESTVSFVKYDFEKANIKVGFNKPSSPMNIKCDWNALKQLFLNLFINAKQSMDNGGLITVDLVKKRNRVVVSVSDEGKGMNRNDLKRVFDPFYSTKATGVGLGLTICKNIVDAHNGKIEVFSNKYKGTRVIVSLPIE